MAIRKFSTKSGDRWQVRWYDGNQKEITKMFSSESEAEKFNFVKCLDAQNRSKRKRDAKLQRRLDHYAAKRKKSVEIHDTNKVESEGILLCAKYAPGILLPVADGAHSDTVVRRGTTDLYNGIQFKVTRKRRGGRAYFQKVQKYPDILVICVVLEDETFWVFHGHQLAHLKYELCISQQSKYNTNLVKRENLKRVIFEMLQMYRPRPMEYFHTHGLCTTKFNEYMAHKRWREKTGFRIKPKALGDVENQVTDAIMLSEDGREITIQEKILSQHQHGFFMCLKKSAGRCGGRKRNSQPYEMGDNDFYHGLVQKYGDSWSHGNDRKKIQEGELIGYFRFPEKVLFDHGFISKGSDLGMVGLCVYLPDSVARDVGYPIPEKRNKATLRTNVWTKDYFIRL